MWIPQRTAIYHQSDVSLCDRKGKKTLRKIVHDMILMDLYWLSGRFNGKDIAAKMLNMMTLKPLMNTGE